MAHQAEPMDIDGESVFDNKENAYQHTNVLPRTPCTEKGYEELDVSELNMKLRYSITPASSPMSKSMSHCLDNRQNNITDESFNNTVINEYENNLTRSLNSTLNKTEVKTSKVLQALPTDIVDNNRSSVLRPLDSLLGNDITITVSNENEIDNLSSASSSSSMAHTPEATTPTKEIPKNEGGSPIMRGLKSVLSMFRSSQSPIPPGEEDHKPVDHAVSPADVALPESQHRAIASTPKNENSRQRSVSRRNSPHKESIVFNEDLEKELQWNDDSTIVFSSEKIPIHKLFFQDKPSKSALSNANVKHEDADSTVEYMDISYNDLSIKDKTLNGTVNKNNITELGESDGEFVDCETTFTQTNAHSKAEERNSAKTNTNQILNVPAEVMENVTTVKQPFTLETTVDIINSIYTSHILEENAEKELDVSTTDIVNQLSDLINESEANATDVISVEDKGTVILDKEESSTSRDVQINNIQPELLQNQVTSPLTSTVDFQVTATEQVCIKNEDLVHTSVIVCDTIIDHKKTNNPKISLAFVDANSVPAHQVDSRISDELTKTQLETIENAVGNPSPVDIPLPNDDETIEVNDNLVENTTLEFQGKVMVNANTSLSALMASLDKPITEKTHDIQHAQVETHNITATCPPGLLTSDDPLLKTDTVNTDNVPHEAITVVYDPAQPPTVEEPDVLHRNITVDFDPAQPPLVEEPDVPHRAITFDYDTAQPLAVEKPFTAEDVVSAQVKIKNNIIDKSTAEATTDISCEQIGVENTRVGISYPLGSSEIPLPDMDDINQTKTEDLSVDSVIDNPAAHLVENKIMDVVSIDDINIVKMVELVSDIPCPPPAILNNPNGEQMETYLESVAMDVSMVDTNLKEVLTLPTNNQHDSCQKETCFLKTIPGTPESIPRNIKVDIDVDNEQNLFGVEMVSNKDIDATINNANVSDPSQMFKEYTSNSGSLNEDVNASVGLMTSKVKQSDASLASENSQYTNTTDDINTGKIENDSNLNLVFEDCTGVVATVTPSLNEQDINIHIVSKKEESAVKNVTDTPVLPKVHDATINLDGTLESKEKIEEEIVLSGGNSPFVSMTAEEFDSQSKKEDIERIESPISTKSKVAQSPPRSPKIVSKGYNFNFDDIDNINPFATKTKIKMSPPPDGSPNTSIVTDDEKKAEKVKPLKNENNINRRKSMPERKKPLKAKRHFNSSIDSTENVSSKMITSKNRDPNNTSKQDIHHEPPHLSKMDINNATSVAPDVVMCTDVLNVTVPPEIPIHEAKDLKEPEITTNKEKVHECPAAHVDEQINNKIIRPENETNGAQNNEIKVIEDVFRSASSSEQSTYFSAGPSSTEQTDSKNVFNLPELDSFNPFTTKSKIRQTPPRDLNIDNYFASKSNIKSSLDTSFIVTSKDCNSTVTIENENDLKEATSNLSTCSSSSKTSEEKDVTVHEVHTEDEDTLEGPFLEADDGNDRDKMPEFTDKKVDVIDFANLNQPDNDEAAEMFIDAEAFEFLMNQNKTEDVAYSGKESLFLKFDPLFARRVTSESVAAASNDVKRKQMTPKRAPKQVTTKEVEFVSVEKPVTGPAELNILSVQSVIEDRSEDVSATTSKPMMAVTPAVNPVVTPRKSLTPSRSNRFSMTFTSPAMAVIDRLLSLSGNSPSAGLDATVTHVDRSHSEADQALTQLRELLAEKEINVYNLRCESKELKDRLTTLETQMKALEAESAQRLKKVNELSENLAEKTKMNKNMAAVVEEYERTIASLISETEQDKKRFSEERNQLVRDRDEQTAHLSSMEVSFNDLHSKYEKSKQVIMGYKTNEDAYKKSIQEFEENFAKMHSNYELLKQHATSKLNHANQELEKINKAHEAEVLKFNAMIKRKELHITSLEETLTQKIKANEELTAICDELINKVG